jgi:hypothetical protein
MRGVCAGSAASFALVFLAAVAASAGDVRVSLKGQTLELKGDDGGADLLLVAPAGLSRGVGSAVVVTPQGGTTLNGAGDDVGFDGVEDVKMTLGDGANVVLFQQLSFIGKLTYKSGDGADQLTIQDTGFGDDVKITLGDGANVLTIFAGSPLGDDLTVKSGSGADSVTLSGPVGGTAKLKLGAGANSLADTAAVGDDFSFKGGSGVDSITLSGPIGGKASIKLSQGTNTATLEDGTPIGESLKVVGGPDGDSVAIGNNGIGGDANIHLSAGSNTTSLTDTTIGDDLIVKGKSGADTVSYAGTVTVIGDTKFKGIETVPVTAF